MALLTFSESFTWKTDGQPDKTNFETLLPTGVKCHTFRMGRHWFPGRKIHFWIGSPRNSRHEYLNPHPLKMPRNMVSYWTKEEDPVALCYAVEDFEMFFDGPGDNFTFRMTVNNQEQGLEVLQLIAYRDGFSSLESFIQYFNIQRQDSEVDRLTGQIVSWKKGFTYSDKPNVILFIPINTKKKIGLICRCGLYSNTWKKGFRPVKSKSEYLALTNILLTEEKLSILGHGVSFYDECGIPTTGMKKVKRLADPGFPVGTYFYDVIEGDESENIGEPKKDYEFRLSINFLSHEQMKELYKAKDNCISFNQEYNPESKPIADPILPFKIVSDEEE